MDKSRHRVRDLVAQPWLEIVARCGLVVAFIYSGIDKLLHFQSAQNEFNATGLKPAALFVIATIVVQLGGSALLFTRRYAGWDALALAGFTALATLIAHRFWEAPPAAYFGELNAFLEHLGLIGAFLLVAHLSALRNSQRPA